MEQDLTVVPPHEGPIEMLPIAAVAEQFARLQGFVKSQMKEGVDYGVIPGTKKNSLLKPGAEKLLNLHALACKLEIVTSETMVDWKQPFFNYCYRASVYNPRTGQVLATADGACNSEEKKYRNTYEKGGDPRDLVNTFMKMAQKRAMVGATLMACRASDIFTTDLEDGEEGAAGGARIDRNTSADKISEGQGKLVFARLKAGGKTQEALKTYLKANLKIESSADILKKDLDEVLQWIAEPTAAA